MIALRIPDLSPSSLQEAERAVIIRALKQSGGHVETAAELLGQGVSTLYRKIKDLNITEEERF